MDNKKEKGSATIEAIVSLSIFVFAFVAIYSIVNMCIVQAAVQQALNKSAKEVSQYYYFVDKFNLADPLSGKGLNEESQKAIGVLDSFEDFLSQGQSTSNQLVGTTQDFSISNIQASIDNVKQLGNSTEDLCETLGKIKSNPMDYLKSFATLAASNVAEDAKNKVAEMLAEAMSERHFEALDLEGMGVREGFEGMDFSGSRILQLTNPEDITLVVVYELEVADILPFDFSITISQSAKTRGWAGK